MKPIAHSIAPSLASGDSTDHPSMPERRCGAWPVEGSGHRAGLGRCPNGTSSRTESPVQNPPSGHDRAPAKTALPPLDPSGSPRQVVPVAEALESSAICRWPDRYRRPVLAALRPQTGEQEDSGGFLGRIVGDGLRQTLRAPTPSPMQIQQHRRVLAADLAIAHAPR